MKEVYRVAPVPAGDVSGICAALYELGGMIVMHDPSGCNSTYNTHDELRWYRKPADIFITGCTMRDLVLGNDRKLIEDVCAAFADIQPQPGFIALCNSPLPYLNGTDFAAICRKLEARCGVPCFYVPSNGMHDYVYGAGQAFLAYAQKILSSAAASLSASPTENRIAVNLLGLTPLDYAAPENVQRLEKLLKKNGFSVQANFAYESDPARLPSFRQAGVNLVLSAAGLPMAEYFFQEYGMPYVIGAPVQGFAASVLAALQEAAEKKQNLSLLSAPEDVPVEAVFIGDAVLMGSLAHAWMLRHQKRSYVLCPFEKSETLLPPSLGRCVAGEEGLETAMQAWAEDISLRDSGARPPVLADPLYLPILPENCRLQALPSLGISGRLYRNSFPLLF